MQCYNNVQDFTDLLNTNVMFFEGKLLRTYYYYAKWGEGEDQNNHAIVSTNNLIQLTKFNRLFTINGQSSYTNMNVHAIEIAIKKLMEIDDQIKQYNMEHNFMYNMFSGCFDNYIMELNLLRSRAYMNLEKEENKVTIQRSYLEFFMESNTFDSIKNKLYNDIRIWYCIVTPDMKIITNMLTRKIYLTDDYTIFTVDNIWRLVERSPYHNINKILDSLYLCHICCRENSTPYTADDIMIDIMKK
jgi:hypothetical protein